MVVFSGAMMSGVGRDISAPQKRVEEKRSGGDWFGGVKSDTTKKTESIYTTHLA